MKIGSFIWGLISFLIQTFLSVVIFQATSGIDHSSVSGAIVLIVTIPLLIILYIVLFGFFLSTTISLFKSIFSTNVVIKVISIILLILNVAEIIFSILFITKVL